MQQKRFSYLVNLLVAVLTWRVPRGPPEAEELITTRCRETLDRWTETRWCWCWLKWTCFVAGALITWCTIEAGHEARQRDGEEPGPTASDQSYLKHLVSGLRVGSPVCQSSWFCQPSLTMNPVWSNPASRSAKNRQKPALRGKHCQAVTSPGWATGPSVVVVR